MFRLTEDQQRLLLELARRSIEEAVKRNSRSTVDPPRGTSLDDILNERCGAFVSLHKSGNLRGCIGHVLPVQPLYQTVAVCAVDAAQRDPRFSPGYRSGENRGGQTWAAGFRRSPPRPASASGCLAVGLGWSQIPGADLPQGRAGKGCLAAGRSGRSLYGSRVRRGPISGKLRYPYGLSRACSGFRRRRVVGVVVGSGGAFNRSLDRLPPMLEPTCFFLN